MPHVAAAWQRGTKRSFESQSPVAQLVSGHLNNILSVTPTAACLVTQTHSWVVFPPARSFSFVLKLVARQLL